MPAEERVGFQDKERILPVFDPTGEENKPEPIGWRKGRLFDLTVKDDELLTKQSIFSAGSALLRVRSAAVLSTIEWGEGWRKCRKDCSSRESRRINGWTSRYKTAGTKVDSRKAIKNCQRSVSCVQLESTSARMRFLASTGQPSLGTDSILS